MRSPAALALRQLPTVTDVAHFGSQVRVTLRSEAQPISSVERWLSRHAVVIQHAQLGRADVEDGFVSLVRDTGEPNAADRANEASGTIGGV